MITQYSKDQQQIIDLLLSEDLSNRNLGLELEKSQDVDLSEFWNELKHQYNPATFNILPPENKNDLIENIMFKRWYNANVDDTEGLPQVIKYMKNLTNVTLRNVTPKTDLYLLSKIPNLEYLNLSNNSLTSLPKLENPSNTLTNLLLDNNKLDVIPPSVFNLTSLNKLALDNNNIKRFPDEIANLINLTDIWLNDNPRIPDLMEDGLINLIANKIKHNIKEPIYLHFPITTNAIEILKTQFNDMISITYSITCTEIYII